MIFYDFEVFKYDWAVVLTNPLTQNETVIINDAQKLRDYYNNNRNEIWIGYNSANYDQYILRAIMLGMNPKTVNDLIINENKRSWEISRDFNKIKLFNYDAMMTGDPSLKTFEGFLGNDIKESTVPFDIDRKLNVIEMKEVVDYCRYDVEQLMEVFLKRKSEFDSHFQLMSLASDSMGHEKMKLNLVNKTKSQLASLILKANKVSRDDEFELHVPENLLIEKYTECAEWYLNNNNHKYETYKTGKSGKKIKVKNQLFIDIAGVPHVLGYGGIHGAIDKYHGEGLFALLDVDALYPTLMINYGLLSRNVAEPELFEMIQERNLYYKSTGEKEKREPYKRTSNSTYGAMKRVNNSLYDPRNANLVCIYGQLFIVDLIEKIENHCELIQSNTDGILIKYKAEDWETIMQEVERWQERTGLNMGVNQFTRVYQKDVNNYVFVPENPLDERGEPTWHSKGAFVKSQHDLDYDLPIINKAITNYFVFGTPVEDTINECSELKEFQMIRKITNKFKHIKYNDKILEEKCVRIFASKSINDGGIFQLSVRTGNYGKIKDSPTKCFIDNSDVNGKKVPLKLDRQWYIDLTKHRLKLFGV